MRIRFCSGGGFCLLLMLAMAILLGMGSWQVQRASEKKEILDQYTRQSARTVMPLDSNQPDYAVQRYRVVSVTGRYNQTRQFLLDNQIRQHQAGYNVLTPLQLTNGKWVLVDRGWVPQGLTRQLLPNIAINQPETQLTGQVYVPFGRAFSLGDIDTGSHYWPRVIQYVAFSEMSERLGYDLLPLVIRLSPESADGYLREWTTVPFTPAKHIAYAVQWFAMAIGLLVIAAIATMKKQNRNDE